MHPLSKWGEEGGGHYFSKEVLVPIDYEGTAKHLVDMKDLSTNILVAKLLSKDEKDRAPIRES